MKQQISSFVQANKAWIIRKTFAHYLRAKNLFNNMDRKAHSRTIVQFEDLKRLSESLFTIKEDLHLVFDRIIQPEPDVSIKSKKFAPNDDEMNFVNNVGLLYHKAMAARELVYVMEYYSMRSDDYEENKEFLDTYLSKMRQLFKEGISHLTRILKLYIDENVILTYLVENDHYVKKSMGMSVPQLLEMLQGRNKIDHSYVQVAVYCLKSGWPERARKILLETLKLNPENETALKLLQNKQ
jgi:hypothetical protein